MSTLAIRQIDFAVTPSVLQSRFNEYQTKIAYFQNQVGLNIPIRTTLNTFDTFPAAGRDRSNIIQIPAWYLFKSEDIPPRFHIHDLHDPRLSNPQFLEDLARWFNEKLRENNLPEAWQTQANSEILLHVIYLMRNSDLFEKCNELGNLIADEKHPLITERIKYLCAWQSQHRSIASQVPI